MGFMRSLGRLFFNYRRCSGPKGLGLGGILGFKDEDFEFQAFGASRYQLLDSMSWGFLGFRV